MTLKLELRELRGSGVCRTSAFLCELSRLGGRLFGLLGILLRFPCAVFQLLRLLLEPTQLPLSGYLLLPPFGELVSWGRSSRSGLDPCQRVEAGCLDLARKAASLQSAARRLRQRRRTERLADPVEDRAARRASRLLENRPRSLREVADGFTLFRLCGA